MGSRRGRREAAGRSQARSSVLQPEVTPGTSTHSSLARTARQLQGGWEIWGEPMECLASPTLSHCHRRPEDLLGVSLHADRCGTGQRAAPESSRNAWEEGGPPGSDPPRGERPLLQSKPKLGLQVKSFPSSYFLQRIWNRKSISLHYSTGKAVMLEFRPPTQRLTYMVLQTHVLDALPCSLVIFSARRLGTCVYPLPFGRHPWGSPVPIELSAQPSGHLSQL